MSDEKQKQEKTEKLRDIFMDLTDSSTVTEQKRESHGTLKDEEDIKKELRLVVEEMVDRYDIRTKLEDEDLVDLVRLYHEGYSDTEIARELGDRKLNKTVSRARIKLHLFRDSDFDAPFDMDRLRDLVANDYSTSEMADELGVSQSTVRSYANVVKAERESEDVNNKYQERFEAILEDRELSEQLTSSAKADGLAEATEGLEVNNS